MHTDNPRKFLDKSGQIYTIKITILQAHAQTHSEVSYFDSVKVVNSQYCAALVLVTNETETLGIPCLLVFHQINIDNLTIPGQNGMEHQLTSTTHRNG